MRDSLFARAQARAALSGQGPAIWAVGFECDAVYSADGLMYPGVVKAVAESGAFMVEFVGYGNTEEVRGWQLHHNALIESVVSTVLHAA